MNLDLFNTILAMDSYNRGYGQGMFLGKLDGNGQPITGSDIDNQFVGMAKIVMDSSVLRGSNNQRLDQASSFYAVAYDIGGAGKIIAYRGTDSGFDAVTGYGVGAGTPDVDQGVLAFGFYREVAGDINPHFAPIYLTGHSLGGGSRDLWPTNLAHSDRLKIKDNWSHIKERGRNKNTRVKGLTFLKKPVRKPANDNGLWLYKKLA